MSTLVEVPDPAVVQGYAQAFTEYPLLFIGIALGLIGGVVAVLAAQRLGWLPNGKAGEIASLRSEVKHLSETVDELLEELKPWRKFQERRMEEFLQTQFNNSNSNNNSNNNQGE